MEYDGSQIMSKKDFLSHGLYDKEPYESFLVSARPDGRYNIGIQLTQDRVLKVDEARADEVRDKIMQWTPHIPDIQREWGEPADLQNYDG
ncbi:MAG: hypothetical protein ACM3UZ_02420 [Acidobacteriota bacterium]